MKLIEMETTAPPGLYDASSDEITKANLTDTRKAKLTLKDLNRLKKLRAFRTLQDLKRRDSLSIIYGQGGDDDEV